MKSRCEVCKLHSYAEKKPGSLIGRLWQWHTGWCPGWKAYQKYLAKQIVREKRIVPETCMNAAFHKSEML